MYLQRTSKKSSKAHIWNKEQQDTECTMWSTGGLNKNKKYELKEATSREICTMCESNYEKRTGNSHDPIRAEAEYYQDLFDFFHQEHGLLLTTSQMDDIIQEVGKYVKEQG